MAGEKFDLRGAAASGAARPQMDCNAAFKAGCLVPVSSHALRAHRRHIARLRQEKKIAEFQEGNRSLRQQLGGDHGQEITHIAVPVCIAHGVKKVVVERLLQHRHACSMVRRDTHSASESAACVAACS